MQILNPAVGLSIASAIERRPADPELRSEGRPESGEPFATVAIVIGADDPIAISYLTPIASWNSGFYLFSVPPNEADDHESELVCLDCLLDDPSLGRGLDIAREYGVADLDEDGEWVARRFPHCAR